MLKAKKMCRNNLTLTTADAQKQFSFPELHSLTDQQLSILMH